MRSLRSSRDFECACRSACIRETRCTLGAEIAINEVSAPISSEAEVDVVPGYSAKAKRRNEMRCAVK
ncbi:hypothetical protein J6590_027528 [Homalodisca vitripennis]|nr:hypothetical protein J6590_027528 [Homalodisca vitripennis]